MKVDIIRILRQPEYTGENRCEPCTVLNLIIAGLFSSAIAWKSKIGGVTTFGVSVGLIYLCGYLVPGTPRLTKQYLPQAVLRWFGKELEFETLNGLNTASAPTNNTNSQSSQVASHDPGTMTEKIDPHKYLLTERILKPCTDQDDLCLTEIFKEEWNEKMVELATENLDGGKGASALELEAKGDSFEIEQYGDAWTLVSDSQILGQWPSHAALLADIAAAHVLDKRSDQWNELASSQKGQILTGLRLFLEHCPGSKGPVSLNQKTVESCCSSYEVITYSCDETGERLFEQPLE
ncbi:hypothetical protein [Halopelagius fulvigenes]|uniref:Uncharacterized protein n=1 Tax=Halopelagius fulvigenes TaxID=1198324 RepID=A0ABD5TST0_9EURY